MRKSLTKTEQWIRAAAKMKYLAKSMPHTAVQQRDRLVIASLELELPTYPWEYPWAEVVRSQRARRRS